MKVAIIGAGYVGLPTAVGLAEYGHDIILVEANQKTFENLNKGILHLYEAGLQELFDKNKRKIIITKEMSAVIMADIIILAVGTPMGENGECDLTYIKEAAKELSLYAQEGQIIATKSTVPVGTGDMIEEITKAKEKGLNIVSLPEFLREGYAVEDFFNPDRIVIGTDSDEVFARVASLYDGHIDNTKIIHTTRRSAELIKYASNAFLAVKIHYINEMANLCEHVGANVQDVAKGMGMDSRIGKKFLNAGVGFGGSCFPKDTRALLKTAADNYTDLTLVHAAYYGNEQRMLDLANKISFIADKCQKKKLAVLGLAFKNGTDDVRCSPAIAIINEIRGIDNIAVYDPKAIEKAKPVLRQDVKYAESIEDCVKDADMIAILTEWQEFKVVENMDFNDTMVILDWRNILDSDKMYNKPNVIYNRIGR